MDKQDNIPLSKRTSMRRLILKRAQDDSGVSGTGIVAEGVEFSNGQVVIAWYGHKNSIAIYPNRKILEEIHGHEGHTSIEIIDT